MKIGLFFSDLDPEVGGGYTFELQILESVIKLANLSNHDFTILSFTSIVLPKTLFTTNIKFVPVNRSFHKNIKSVVCGTINAIFKRIPYPQIKFASTFIAEVQSAINHQIFLEYQLDLIWFVSPKCLTVNIPYGMTVWDLEHRKQPYFPEISSGNAWDRRESFYSTALKRASFIITGTQVGKAELQEFYQIPSDRIKVLPMPTPQFAIDGLGSDKTTILEKYALTDNYLFYPAQFWSHKNHANLLFAVKLLKDKYNLNFTLVLTGSDRGGNLSHIQQLVNQLELTDCVKFLGFVSQSDLIQLYTNAFALIFVSFFGPDNLPPLEAFALGCPVVAANVSGAKEQLGEAALFIDPKSPEQIALAIQSLYRDQNLRKILIQRGLERSATWKADDYIKSIFNILDEFETIRRCWK
jgi:glycosyltransferase involved in cell wall biosynthesis